METLRHVYPPPADGHLGYFHSSAVMINAAMNIPTLAFVWIYGFNTIHPGVEVLGGVVTPRLTF